VIRLRNLNGVNWNSGSEQFRSMHVISCIQSATSRTCVVRRTYSNYGDRRFAAAGPKLWNSLPDDLRQADISFQQFKRLLKTFLFWC